MFHLIRVSSKISAPPLPAPTTTLFFRYTCNSADSEKSVSTNVTSNDANQTTAGDVMYQSFGAEYATRSVEEGFGGVYGRGDADPEHDDGAPREKLVPADHSGGSRGSGLKEKEKGRDGTESRSCG